MGLFKKNLNKIRKKILIKSIQYIGKEYYNKFFITAEDKRNKKKKIIFFYNHLLYLSKLYEFIKNFNKSRRYLYNEFLDINKRLIRLNKLTKNSSEILLFYNKILNDKYIFQNFRDDDNLLYYEYIIFPFLYHFYHFWP